jgi:hypothetical protein
MQILPAWSAERKQNPLPSPSLYKLGKEVDGMEEQSKAFDSSKAKQMSILVRNSGC